MSRIGPIIDKIKSVPGVGTIGPMPVPPQPDYPDVRVQEILNQEYQSMSGPSGLRKSVIQINVYDKDYSEAWAMREAIKAALIDPEHVDFIQDHELYDGQRELHQCIARIMFWGESTLA